MPWRRTHDPYRILVSEIMLQQTQVDRVRTKYIEFLKKFPRVEILARTPFGDVLRLWSGLGYNRRARYLHECAKEVVAKHKGKFPSDLASLQALPGVGLSTAAALSAFSFQKDEPMIDTNIRRILARTFFKNRISGDKELYVFAKTLIPAGKGGAWNYAMLDLGATLCTARNHSPFCPLMKLHGKVGDFVYKKPQKKFLGSDRYYRGKLVAFLATKKRSSVGATQDALGLSNIRAHKIIKKLLHEGLLRKRGDVLRLP